MRKRRILEAALTLALAVSGSSGSTSTPDPVTADADRSVALEGASTLVFEDGGRLEGQRVRIEEVVRSTLVAVRRLMPLERVTIVIAAVPGTVIPEIGIGGRADAATVRITVDPNFADLATSLDRELFPLLAHELHHVARSRTAGYGSTLLGAMVSEGLADQFAVEVAGIDPPLWSSALTPEEHALWSARAREEWFNAGYDHDAWFFGTTPPIPRWAGYTIGFEMVGEFLVRNPSRRASDLFAEPAVSFVPSES